MDKYRVKQILETPAAFYERVVMLPLAPFVGLSIAGRDVIAVCVYEGDSPSGIDVIMKDEPADSREVKEAFEQGGWKRTAK